MRSQHGLLISWMWLSLRKRDTERKINFALEKAKFFDRFRDQLAERQLKVIKRMLEEGPDGFEGGINAGKYGSLTIKYRRQQLPETSNTYCLSEL